jgi:hypothetical protein
MHEAMKVHVADLMLYASDRPAGFGLVATNTAG